jgi:hypothetical protein
VWKTRKQYMFVICSQKSFFLFDNFWSF